MGESTDPSEESDESIEVSERSEDQATGAFGGSGTNVGDPSDSIGFSSPSVEADYNISQDQIRDAYASGQALGANLGNVTAQDMGLNTIGNTLAQQDFAREQSFFDQNPMSTAVDAPFTSRMADINVGAGDIFGLKNSIANQLSRGGTPVFSPDGTIGGVMGSIQNAPAFGALPSFMKGMLPDAQVYTGIPDLDPNNNSTMSDGENGQSATTPPVTNPITGKEQCPDGYVFDNDLQACRLKTKADDVAGTPKDPVGMVDMNAPAFTRNYSLLNTTPSNVPQGFDFNQANQNFMSRFATRPSIFKQPPNLLGFTPFRSS